jgi:hypothetical protein
VGVRADSRADELVPKHSDQVHAQKQFKEYRLSSRSSDNLMRWNADTPVRLCASIVYGELKKRKLVRKIQQIDTKTMNILNSCIYK